MSDNFLLTSRYSACADVKMMYSTPKWDPHMSDNYSPTTRYSVSADVKMNYASRKLDPYFRKFFADY